MNVFEAVKQSVTTRQAAARMPVDAMTSWTQFYKNIPLALIIFVLVCSSTFTAEYQKGTLILVVTKGLSREKIMLAKTVMMAALWTAGYVTSYSITWLYNSWFWDNSIARHTFFGAVCYWVFGVWVIALMLLFSAVASASAQVLAGTGGVVVAVYVLGLFPKFKMMLPSKLMDGMILLQGTELPSDYYASMGLACLTGILCVGLAVACFKRKML